MPLRLAPNDPIAALRPKDPPAPHDLSPPAARRRSSSSRCCRWSSRCWRGCGSSRSPRHTAWSASAAAHAAARAEAIGLSPGRAARAHLPARLERGLRLRAFADGRVKVTVLIPSSFGLRLGTTSAVARFDTAAMRRSADGQSTVEVDRPAPAPARCRASAPSPSSARERPARPRAARRKRERSRSSKAATPAPPHEPPCPAGPAAARVSPSPAAA